MSKKIFIVAIPGIGSHVGGFSQGFKNDLAKFSKNTSLENNYQVFECLPFNTTQVNENQKSLYTRIDAANQLGGYLSFRKIVMQSFGDGVTFEHKPQDINSTYQRIHGYLKGFFQELNQKMQETENPVLVIVAASMASHILSTYIWDADNSQGIFAKIPANKTNNLRNLNYLVSLGSNIPLFVSGLSESKIQAFEKRNPDFVWDNFYDKDDVLGWPLKPLSESYQALVNDYQINTGLYVGAHVKYWDDNNFTKPFIERIIKQITA